MMSLARDETMLNAQGKLCFILVSLAHKLVVPLLVDVHHDVAVDVFEFVEVRVELSILSAVDFRSDSGQITTLRSSELCVNRVIFIRLATHFISVHVVKWVGTSHLFEPLLSTVSATLLDFVSLFSCPVHLVNLSSVISLVYRFTREEIVSSCLINGHKSVFA